MSKKFREMKLKELIFLELHINEIVSFISKSVYIFPPVSDKASLKYCVTQTGAGFCYPVVFAYYLPKPVTGSLYDGE